MANFKERGRKRKAGRSDVVSSASEEAKVTTTTTSNNSTPSSTGSKVGSDRDRTIRSLMNPVPTSDNDAAVNDKDAVNTDAEPVSDESILSSVFAPSTNTTDEENTECADSATEPASPTPSAEYGACSQPSKKRKTTASDPINILIYTLRQQGLDFATIANRVSDEYSNMRTGDKWSEPACYGRFKRNGATVARSRGEDFDMDWYTHMKGPIDIAKIKTKKQAAGEESEKQNKDACVDGGDREAKTKNVVLPQAIADEIKAVWEAIAKLSNRGEGSEEGTRMVKQVLKKT